MKLCILGDPMAGKSTLIQRFFEEINQPPSAPGATRHHAVLHRDDVPVELTLSEVRDQDASATSIRALCSDADGALIVCDTTQPETAKSARFYAELVHIAQPTARLAFIANKADDATPAGLLDRVKTLADTYGAPCYVCRTDHACMVKPAFEWLATTPVRSAALHSTV